MEGDIEEVDGVLRITTIRLHYRVTIPAGMRERVEKLLEVYAQSCPAYQSVKGCIDVSWTADLTEEES